MNRKVSEFWSSSGEELFKKLEPGFNNPIDESIRFYKKFDLKNYYKIEEIPYDFIRKCLSILVKINNQATGQISESTQ